MSRELESAIDKLGGMQSPDGGFPWFKGGMDDRYITQYILAGIGHLWQRARACRERVVVVVDDAVELGEEEVGLLVGQVQVHRGSGERLLIR